MSIQVNAGASAVNWEALLGKIGDVQKTTGTDGRETLTVTVKSADGQSSYTFGVPDDLDLPGAVDQTDIDALCAKLETSKDVFNMSDGDIASLKQALTNALADVKGAVNTSSKSVMFDLYKLMALLVEVAQKQRDAAREQRLAENTKIQQSILAQADQQRTAALTGLITSVACSAIQVGFSLYTVAKEGSAYKQQMNTLETSGVNTAKEGLNMLQAADSSANAQKQLQAVKAEVGDHVANNVRQGFHGTAEAEQRYISAQTAKTADALKLNRVQDMNQPLNEADIPAGSKLAEAKANLDAYNALEQEMQTLDAKDPNTRNFADTKRLVELKTQINDVNRAKFENAVNTERAAYADQLRNNIQTDHPNAIDAARQNYRAAIKNDLSRYENEHANALSERALLPENATPAQKAAAELKISQAAANLKYARAYANNELAQRGVTTANERAADVKLENVKIDAAQNTRQTDKQYLDAARNISKFQAYNNIISAVGNVAQSAVQSFTTIMQADATKEGVQQQREKEELEQTKDLFAQAQDLIKQVVQLLQAISAAETQSMRDAIQA